LDRRLQQPVADPEPARGSQERLISIQHNWHSCAP
jgi:hypothetical protein